MDRIEGTLSWQRPSSKDQAYPAGFSGNIAAQGSRYTPPAPGTAALAINDWNLVLGANVLSKPLTATATLDQRNRFTLTGFGLSTTSLRVDPTTGLLAGRTTLNGLEPMPFRGVLLLEQRIGRGFLALPDRTGSVTLDPP
jgi:hypothetical protein